MILTSERRNVLHVLHIFSGDQLEIYITVVLYELF